jgi:hypothetical protein
MVKEFIFKSYSIILIIAYSFHIAIYKEIIFFKLIGKKYNFVIRFKKLKAVFNIVKKDLTILKDNAIRKKIMRKKNNLVNKNIYTDEENNIIKLIEAEKEILYVTSKKIKSLQAKIFSIIFNKYLKLEISKDEASLLSNFGNIIWVVKALIQSAGLERKKIFVDSDFQKIEIAFNTFIRIIKLYITNFENNDFKRMSLPFLKIRYIGKKGAKINKKFQNIPKLVPKEFRQAKRVYEIYYIHANHKKIILDLNIIKERLYIKIYASILTYIIKNSTKYTGKQLKKILEKL